MGMLSLLIASTSATESFNFFVIGDAGWPGYPGQKKLAAQMDKIAATVQPSLIINTGDNFYDPDGVDNIADDSWRSHWYDIFKRDYSHILPLPWHGVLGNHDYCKNTTAQFEYRKDGWKIEDYFWWETFSINKLYTVGVLFIETDLLAYGMENLPDWICPGMLQTFTKLNKKNPELWSQDGHIQMIKKMLDDVRGQSDVLFVVGHHPIGGGPCAAEGRLGELRDLFEAYSVAAYFGGHVHVLDFAVTNEVMHVTSGAGGDEEGNVCVGPPPLFSKDKLSGFVSGSLHTTLVGINCTLQFIDASGQLLYTHERRLILR